MRHSLLRTVASVLVVFYLFGGHASVHGLSWCLATDDHAHLEQVTGHCATPALTSSCSAEDACAAAMPTNVEPAESDHEERSDCHHLPVTTPHQSSAKQRLVHADDQPPVAIVFSFTCLSTSPGVSATVSARHQVEHLPPLQALVALRTVVLVC